MQKALVIGLGISGRASCQLLLKMGYEVVAVDNKEIDGLSSDVEFYNEDSSIHLPGFHLVIVSPGVSPAHPLYRQAIQQAIPIMGEAQIALSQLSQTTIGITGTNGKTTVTSLVTHCLVSSGYKAVSIGNIGDPISLYALKPNPEEVLVVELSSYQLETMQGRLLDAAVILNITPDHLERYDTMNDYARAKWRIQYCLKNGGPLFVFDEVVEEFGHLDQKKSTIAYSPNQSIALKGSKGYKKNRNHDQENALAAWLLVKTFGISEEQFLQALSTFKKPAHRIEHIGTIGGVRYYDDSKGTNLDAVIRAVESMKGLVWLIAGGVDKGASYALWKQPFAGKVKKIFAIGQAKRKIAQEVNGFCLVEELDSLEQAVRRASQEAGPDDNILLSPGCSSFDMFRDYAHRGEEFQSLVRRLELERRESL